MRAVIFSLRGRETIVERTATDIHGEIVTALVDFRQQNIISNDEFDGVLKFIAKEPPLDRLSYFLSENLPGFIWTEFPEFEITQ